MEGKTFEDLIELKAKEKVEQYAAVAREELRASFDAIVGGIVRMNKYKSGDLLDERQLAEYLGLTVSCLQSWRNKRQLIPYVRLSDKVVRYKYDDVLAFLQRGYVRVTQDGKVL